MIVRELITLLGFEVDNKGSIKAGKTLKDLTKKARLATAAVGAISTALAVKALHDFVVEGDRAAKTAKQIGVSAEEFQELEFAAKRSGVALEPFLVGIRTLQKNAVESTLRVNEFTKTFRRLGVNVKDSSGKIKPTVRLFTDVGESLSKIQNASVRAQAAQKLLGEGGAKLLPLFLEGAEGIDALRRRARALGFIINNETAGRLEHLQDNFTDLSLVATGVSRKFAASLTPALTRITDQLLESATNSELFKDGFKGIENLANKAAKGITKFVKEFEKSGFGSDDMMQIAKVALPALGVGFLALALPIFGVALAATLAAAAIGLIIEDILHDGPEGTSVLDQIVEAFDELAANKDSNVIIFFGTLFSSLRDISNLAKVIIEDFKTLGFIGGSKLQLNTALGGGKIADFLVPVDRTPRSVASFPPTRPPKPAFVPVGSRRASGAGGVQGSTNLTINNTVNAQTNSSATEIVDKLKKKTTEATQDFMRQISREFKPVGVR